MTREEQKYLKEVSKNLEMTIKKMSKVYGYKTISGFVYKFVGDFVYVAIITVAPIDLGKSITTRLYFKPLILDELFWEIFEIHEGKKMPKSFHVNGAFTVPIMEVKNWREPIECLDNIESAFNNIIIELDKQIDNLRDSVADLSAFSRYSSGQPNSQFISILVTIYEKQYKRALELISKEFEMHQTSPFLDSGGKSFYDYARDYCNKRAQ